MSNIDASPCKNCGITDKAGFPNTIHRITQTGAWPMSEDMLVVCGACRTETRLTLADAMTFLWNQAQQTGAAR